MYPVFHHILPLKVVQFPCFKSLMVVLGFCTDFLPLLSLPFVSSCMPGTVLSRRSMEMVFKESVLYFMKIGH